MADRQNHHRSLQRLVLRRRCRRRLRPIQATAPRCNIKLLLSKAARAYTRTQRGSYLKARKSLLRFARY